MTDRTLYREANTKEKDREAWYDGKAKHMWVVPVEPCVHGNYAPHIWFDWNDNSEGECDGKPEGDDD